MGAVRAAGRESWRHDLSVLDLPRAVRRGRASDSQLLAHVPRGLHHQLRAVSGAHGIDSEAKLKAVVCCCRFLRTNQRVCPLCRKQDYQKKSTHRASGPYRERCATHIQVRMPKPRWRKAGFENDGSVLNRTGTDPRVSCSTKSFRALAQGPIAFKWSSSSWH